MHTVTSLSCHAPLSGAPHILFLFVDEMDGRTLDPAHHNWWLSGHGSMVEGRGGEWVEVCADTRLPATSGFGGGADAGPAVVYGRSADPREMWVPLLQKAYAKLRGSYEALHAGGSLAEALVDVTGGSSEEIALGEDTPTNSSMLVNSSTVMPISISGIASRRVRAAARH